MDKEIVDLIDSIAPALECYAVLQLEPVCYVHTYPDGYRRHIPLETACATAAKVLRKMQEEYSAIEAAKEQGDA